MPQGANVDTNDVYKISGLSAGALNIDLVPAIDVSQYAHITLSIGNNGYTGVLTFYGTDTPADANSWAAVALDSLNDRFQGGAHVVNTYNAAYGGSPIYSWFKCTMTGYSSGTAIGTLILSKNAPAYQLLADQTELLPSSAKIGIINNDGTDYAVIAAGLAADTVVKASPALLSHVLVTATGTNAMQIFNNDAAGSGDCIGIVKASDAAILGSITPCKAPCGAGITVKGNAANPGVTVFFTPA
jgi:hypothetical protein